MQKDELRRQLVETWREFQQSVVNDWKLVFSQTVFIPNRASDVVYKTIFHTIQQPVLFSATHFSEENS